MLEPSGDKFLGDERNVLLALRCAPELRDLVRFNEFAFQVEFARQPPWRHALLGSNWLETDDVMGTAWLQEQHLKVRGTAVLANCITVVAQDNSYHPVRQFFETLKWDGVPRAARWVRDYLRASGDERYLAAIGQRFLVSAIARILKPGCQADHVLVLEGPQGIFKSSTARTLAMRPEWFAGSLPDIHSKDAALQLLGRWIIEISELRAIRNSQVEAVKNFITETRDTFRPPYGRRAAQFPRQCVFIATTNETEYLKDRTGNRRYWPVKCGRIDIEAIERDREQLWAEALELYRAGTAWHLSPEENDLAMQQQIDRVHLTELEQDVASYLERQRAANITEISVRDVLVHGLGVDPDKGTYTEQARRLGPEIAQALQREGWQKSGRKRGENSAKRTLYRFQQTAGQGGQPI